MTISRQRIVSNVSFLMVSQVVGWGLNFLLIIFLPRYLGAESWGQLSLAGSLWIIVSNFATFGMDTYLTREVARDHNRLDTLLSQSILFRLLFFIAGAIFLSIYLQFTDYSVETLQIIAILAINCLMTLMGNAISAIVQALERMKILAYSSIISHILVTILSFAAIFLGFGVTIVAWINSTVAVIVLIFLIFSLIRLHPFKFHLSAENYKGFLAACFSFFLLYIFINLYHQMDMVVISLLVDEKSVGLYSVADRLLGSIFFVPTVFMTVLFPTFSRLSKENPDALSGLFRKAFNMMIWTGTALGLGTLIISDQIVLLIYGSEFLKSGPVLALRGVITTCTFANIILGMYFMSIDRQKSWLMVLAIATFTQIPLNVIFVPIFENTFANGALGAALSCVVTEAGMMVAGIFLLPRQTINRQTSSYILRTILAGAGMVLGSWWIRDEFILFPLAVGVILFIALSYFLKLLSGEEWQLLYEVVGKITSKIRSKLYQTAS